MSREDLPEGDWPAPFLDPFEREAPYAEIQQVGRWWWRITIRHGVMVWGPEGGSSWFLGKREWAEWRASHLLAKYWRIYERTYSDWPTIRVG